MLQVKNSNSPKSWLTLLAVALLTVLTVSFSGCQDNNNPQDLTPFESLVGSVETPAWQSPEDYDMTASMTAIVRVDISQSFTARQLAEVKKKLGTDQVINEGDLLAAFSGETCLGVDTIKVGQTDLFFLFMAGSNDVTAKDIQLRYYSTLLKNILIANQSFAFSNDGHIGSVKEPYTPTWAIAK